MLVVSSEFNIAAPDNDHPGVYLPEPEGAAVRLRCHHHFDFTLNIIPSLSFLDEDEEPVSITTEGNGHGWDDTSPQKGDYIEGKSIRLK